jgi:hypothetical protein
MSTAYAFKTAQTKPAVISTTKETLKNIIYWGNHYHSTSNGMECFITKGTKVCMDDRYDSLSIEVELTNPLGEQIILLHFSKNPNDQSLQFHHGYLSQGNTVEEISSPSRLMDIGLCLYRNVREATDPKWGVDLEICSEARQTAAQLLDTGMLPKLLIDNGVLEFSAPQADIRPVCTKKCKGCRLG